MKSESFTNCQASQRINEQIESLRQYEHIKYIEKVSQQVFTLHYRPLMTNSPYKQRTYTLQLVLPTNYPESPPSLRFLDRVYHLNIGFNSGQVRMPILQDDWSPFLSLTSVIESLDKILEQPDQEYALDAQTLDLYQTQTQKYNNKVLENISLCDVVLCYSAQKHPSPSPRSVQFSDVSVGKYTIQRPYSPKKKDKSSILVEQLRKSMQLNEGLLTNQNIQIKDQFMQNYDETGHFPQLIRVQSKQKAGNDRINSNEIKILKSRTNLNNESKSKIRQSIEMDETKSVEVAQTNFYQMKSRPPKMQAQSYEQKNNPLIKINKTINLFLQQLNQIQQQMQLAKNQGLKILLRQKYDTQLQMLRQLMQMSEEVKKKMIKKLKQEVNRM